MSSLVVHKYLSWDELCFHLRELLRCLIDRDMNSAPLGILINSIHQSASVPESWLAKSLLSWLSRCDDDRQKNTS